MPQEEVTKQAPEVLEQEALTQEQLEDAYASLDELGVDPVMQQGNIQNVLGQDDPFSATGFEEEYVPQEHEFDQGWLADAGAGLYNGLVVSGGEGLANFIPTIAQAAGVESDFIDQWSTNVTNFFEGQKAIYSDRANAPIEEFGDINSSHFATAFGQGVGFLVGIIGTGGAAGGATKAASILSKLGKAEKAIQATKAVTKAEKAAKFLKLEQYRKGTAKLRKAAEATKSGAARTGSFLAGTALMYPEIQKEAVRAGLDKQDAALFSLGVSGLVSATEGAALEWIGKLPGKYLRNAAAKSAAVKALKSGETGVAAQKAFLKNWGGIVKERAAMTAEGAAIEFGQEFTQTYIEQGAKNLFDEVYKGEGKGEFGVDATNYKTFVESVFGGVIGSLLGGGMANIQTGSSLGGALAKEGMYGYVNNAVQTGDLGRVAALQQEISNLEKKGNLTKKEAQEAQGLLKDIYGFATDIDASDMKDNVGKYQLFELDRIRKKSEDFKKTVVPNTDNPTMNTLFQNKQDQLSQVEKSIQENFDSIFNSKEQSPKTKEEFDGMLKDYADLMQEIKDSEISEADFKEKIGKFETSDTSVAEGNARIDGIDLPIEAIKDIDGIVKSYEEVVNENMTEEEWYSEMETVHGLSKEQADKIRDDKDLLAKYEGTFKTEKTEETEDSYEGKTVQELSEMKTKLVEDFKNVPKEKRKEAKAKIDALSEAIKKAKEPTKLPDLSKPKEVQGPTLEETLSDIEERRRISMNTNPANAKGDRYIRKQPDGWVGYYTSPNGKTQVIKAKTKQAVKDKLAKKYEDETISAEDEYLNTVLEGPNLLTTLTDEQLEDSKRRVQQKIDDLGDTPNIYSLQRFAGERAAIEEEQFRRKDAIEKEKQDAESKGRQAKLSRKAKTRRKRSKKEPAVQKQYSKDLKVVDENTAEYRGKEYEIVSDEKGNVTALWNEQEKEMITNEKLLTKVEIDRNIMSYQEPTQTVQEMESATQEVVDGTAVDTVRTVNEIVKDGLTQEIADIINRGFPSEITLDMIKAIDAYIENVLNRLTNEVPGSTYAEDVYNSLLKRKTELDTIYENEYETETERQEKRRVAIEKANERIARKPKKKATKAEQEENIKKAKTKKYGLTFPVTKNITAAWNKDTGRYDFLDNNGDVVRPRRDTLKKFTAMDGIIRTWFQDFLSPEEQELALNQLRDLAERLQQYESSENVANEEAVIAQTLRGVKFNPSIIQDLTDVNAKAWTEEGGIGLDVWIKENLLDAYKAEGLIDQLGEFSDAQETQLTKDVKDMIMSNANGITKTALKEYTKDENEEAIDNLIYEFEDTHGLDLNTVLNNITDQIIEDGKKTKVPDGDVRSDQEVEESTETREEEVVEQLEIEEVVEEEVVEDPTQETRNEMKRPPKDENKVDDIDLPFQKEGFGVESELNQTIKENSKLYNDIKELLLAAYPDTTVEEIESMVEKFGVDALAAAQKNKIYIQKDKALQSSILHEYAHVFLDGLGGAKNPLIKAGMELLRGSDLHKEAIKLYPELSEDEQLLEALAESLALKNLDRLKTKFEGTLLEKFMAWAKRFWNRVKGVYNKKHYTALDTLARKMIKGNKKFTVQSLFDAVKFQKQKAADFIAQSKTIQNIISSIKVANIKGVLLDDPATGEKVPIDAQNRQQMRNIVYSKLLQRYNQEKDPVKGADILNPLFENINLNAPSAYNLREAMKTYDPDFYNFTENAISSVTKTSKIQAYDRSQNDESEAKDNNSAIKGHKGFSPSIKSVLSGIVDDQGKPISPDEIYRYAAGMAGQALNEQELYDNIKKRAIESPNNVLAGRVSDVLSGLDEGSRRSVLWEMASSVQEASKKVSYTEPVDTETGERGRQIVVKQLNTDYDNVAMVDNFTKRLKKFKNNEAYQRIFADEIEEGWWGQTGQTGIPAFARRWGKDGEAQWDLTTQKVVENREFRDRLSLENPSEHTRDQFNKVMSVLLGESVPTEYTNMMIDNGSAQQQLWRLATNTPDFDFSFLKGKGKMSKPVSITGDLKKIARGIEGIDLLKNSYVNSKGNNVSSTTVGHWMSQNIKRIAKDKKYRDQLLSKDNQIFKNNTILNYANDNNKGKIDMFTVDAIDNNGVARELSEMSEDDIKLLQVLAFTNSSSLTSYPQMYGVQGDRSYTTMTQAPRLTGNALTNSYNELKTRDEYLRDQFKSELKEELSKKLDGKKYTERDMSEEYKSRVKQYVDMYNKTGLNFMDENTNIFTPFENGWNGRTKEGADQWLTSRAEDIQELIESNGLGNQYDEDGNLTSISPVLKDHVKRTAFSEEAKQDGQNWGSYENEIDMYKDFILNESLNRQHLNALFQGPAMQRKSIEDHIKRALGTNSNIHNVNIDKPVLTVVVDAPSMSPNLTQKDPTSDSFSVNSPKFYDRINYITGDLNEVGPNTKDFLFQIDPNTGKMAFFKMSSINLTGTREENNFKEMVDPKRANGRVQYDSIAEAIFNLQDYYDMMLEKTGDKEKYDVYIKVIDKKAIKGNEGLQATPINIDKLLTESQNNIESLIGNNSFVMNYDNYGIPFNLNKDLRKIPLNQQNVTMSSQLAKLSLNVNDPKAVQKFETLIVQELKKSLGIKKGARYKDSSIYKDMMKLDQLLQGVMSTSEETGKTSVVNLIDTILVNNDAIDEETKALRQELTALQKNGSDDIAKMEELKIAIDAANTEKITALDHPNLKVLIDQYVGSRMAKAGTRTMLPGAYLHMIPDYGNTLKAPTVERRDVNPTSQKEKIKVAERALKKAIKVSESVDPELKVETEEALEAIPYLEKRVARLKQEQEQGWKEKMSDFEVAVPWSMFGRTRKEAEDFIAKRKAEKNPVKLALVRVPASWAVSTFAADVGYLTDGAANTVIIPDEALKMADADHDADKMFTYREELKTNEKGETEAVPGVKSEIFWQLYNNLSSEEFMAEHDADLSTDVIEQILEDNNLRSKDSYRLNTYADVASILSKYSFGSKAIGIEAVAGKMLSMLTQSNVSLKAPVTFDGKEYNKFVPDNALVIAKVLQAALDMGNDPILLETGINKHTISPANAMLSVGVPLEDVIKFMRSAPIETFVKKLDQGRSVFSVFSDESSDSILQAYESELSGVKDSGLSNMKELELQAQRKVGLDKKFEIGQTYSVKDGRAEGLPFYFTVIENEAGKRDFVTEGAGPSVSSEYRAMQDFVKFEEIADDLKTIIPVVQMDNNMPKGSLELRRALGAFEAMRASKGNKSTIDFNPILERPTTAHYEELLNLIKTIQEKHYATEKGSFPARVQYDDKGQPIKKKDADGKVIDDPANAKNQINRVSKDIEKGDGRKKIVDSLMHVVAQGDLERVGTPDKFIRDFHTDMKTILDFIQDPDNYQHEVPEINEYYEAVLSEDADLIKELEDFFDADLLSDAKAYAEMMADITEQLGVDPRNNMFLNNVVLNEYKNGTKALTPAKDYRKLGEHIKDQMREDFNKLGEDLKQRIIDYQMLRNGINDKLGSLIDLLPQQLQVEYLRKMSKAKNSGESQSKFENSDLLNAVQDNASAYPNVEIKNGIFQNEGWSRDRNDVMVKAQLEKGIGSPDVQWIRTKYFKMNNFVKFDPNATVEKVNYDAQKKLKDC